MYQQYSIGMMANLLGISAEAIRYYESKNIIAPKRDPETGYRYYNTWDLHMLIRARHYQNYGFSLEEVADLFRSRDLGAIKEQMKGQESGIEKEILRQINLLKRIRQSQAMLEDAKNSVGEFRIEERPGIYRMNTQKNYTLFREKSDLEIVSEWTDKTPFVYSCAVFYEKDIRQGISDFDFGLGLNEEYAQFLNVKESELVQYYPPCTCVHTCIPSRSSQYLTLDTIRPGLDYLRSNGLTLAGDVVTQVVCMVKPEEEYFNWHIAWFPIMEAK
ncbi:MAG: MerR family transcriptional regulator [Enterocloster sp.]